MKTPAQLLDEAPLWLMIGLWIALVLLLTCGVPSYSQTAPADHSPDKTHKAQHERTPYLKADGKTPCGLLMEMKVGRYRVVLGSDLTAAPTFDTRAEAVKWLAIYCPVAGKTGHD